MNKATRRSVSVGFWQTFFFQLDEFEKEEKAKQKLSLILISQITKHLYFSFFAVITFHSTGKIFFFSAETLWSWSKGTVMEELMVKLYHWKNKQFKSTSHPFVSVWGKWEIYSINQIFPLVIKKRFVIVLHDGYWSGWN